MKEKLMDKWFCSLIIVVINIFSLTLILQSTQTTGLRPEGNVAMVKSASRLPWSRIWAVFVLMVWGRRNNVTL
jgi:hypothetical protein